VKKDDKWEEFIKKKEEELKYEKEKYKKQRRQAEEKRKKKKESKEAKEKLNEILLKYSNINSIPMDIINWMNHTTKKGRDNLVKKYHPDKNKDVCIDYIKFINEWWHKSKKVSFVSCK
jgi:DNA phosphorothioation-dependent restriction protein DptG